MSFPSHSWKSTLLSAGLALLCLGALGALQVPQLNHLLHRSEDLSPEELAQEMETERSRLALLTKIPAFGFDNLLADWIFLSFLQYFGDDEVRLATSYELSPDYFDIIVNRDPRFQQSYLFLSTSTSIYAGMPDRSVALMAQGLKSLSILPPADFYSCIALLKIAQTVGRQPTSMPTCSAAKRQHIQANDWNRANVSLAWDYSGESPRYYYIWRYKGTDELLFLGEADAPEQTLKQAEQSFKTAAQWAGLYAELYDDADSRSLAQVSRNTVDFLSKKPDITSAQISAWGNVAINAAQNGDSRTINRALERIRLLGASKRLQTQTWMVVFNNAAAPTVREMALEEIRKLGGQVIEDPQHGIVIIPPAVESSPETSTAETETE